MKSSGKRSALRLTARGEPTKSTSSHTPRSGLWLELVHRLADQVPDELDKRRRCVVHLSLLNGPEERNALVAPDRRPREARAQKGVIHEEPAEAAVAVHEGMNGRELSQEDLSFERLRTRTDFGSRGADAP